MKLPFKVDLSGKVVAVTGAGGVICSEFARALAECGAKVALLDINGEAAKKVADEIGGNALALKCNCLDKSDLERAKEEINAAVGAVNFLINGAGGNNPKATTDNEYMTPDTKGIKDFFALEESGLKFVFDLNIITAFLATHERVHAADQNPGVQRSKSGHIQFHRVARGAFRALRHTLQRHRARLFRDKSEQGTAVQRRRHSDGAHGQDPRRHSHEEVRGDKRPRGVSAVARGRLGERVRDGRGHTRGRRVLGVQRGVI